MNRKFTLLAAALMTVGTFTANAQDVVPEAQWTAGNYYYLKANTDYLSVSGSKADSVIVKPLDVDDASKAAIDSALWQIADKETALGVTTYKLTNKATQQVLSFAAKADANTNLASGVDRWVLSENGSTIKGFYEGDKTLELVVTAGKLSLAATGGASFKVKVPESDFELNAEQLGNGFSVFQLMFGDTYEENIFEGKELVAKDLTEADEKYVSLQVQGDETYSDGKAKFLGVDTTKIVISGAIGAYGAKFAIDSTYTQLVGVHSIGNADFQKFKFTVNLKNDSIAMFVKAAPDVNAATLALIENVRVVYAQTGSKKVLTVSKTGDDQQGALPKITAKRGTPAVIPTGDGVYSLQKVGKGANNGKYFVAEDNVFMGGDSVPSVHQLRGQWFIKEKDGKYAIVDRESDTKLVTGYAEIFGVQGMEDTYLIGDDSIKVEKMNVDLKNKYLGSFVATEQELVNKGYYLSLFSGTAGVPELFMFADDSVLKGSAEDMQLFKLFPQEPVKVAGAQSLGDTISMIPFQLGGYFREGRVAKGEGEGLKFSTTTNAISFHFLSDAVGQFYSMKTVGGKYVGIDVNTSKLQLTNTKTIVNIAPDDAPEYATFEAGHKRLVSDGNSLAMNPLNLFAQMKTEGSEITKAAYETDNFSLWIEPDTMVAGKQLYFISSGSETGTRYYMSVKDTSFTGINYDKYAMFVEDNDTITTMKDSPALFAFKVNEHGGYLLENHKELKNGGKPYVGVVNGFVVLEQFPHVAFEVEAASAPTANEEMNVSEIKVISSDGQVIVSNASGRKITLSNILGQTIGVRRASSEYFAMPATSGIVLVTVEGDTTYKVIVK